MEKVGQAGFKVIQYAEKPFKITMKEYKYFDNRSSMSRRIVRLILER